MAGDAETELRQIIAQHTSPPVRPSDILPDVPLPQQGVDSFAYMEILLDVETVLGIRIDDEDLVVNNLDTLNHFRGMVEARRQV